MQYDQVTDSIRKLSLMLHITGSGSILPIYWNVTSLINQKVMMQWHLDQPIIVQRGTISQNTDNNSMVFTALGRLFFCDQFILGVRL